MAGLKLNFSDEYGSDADQKMFKVLVERFEKLFPDQDGEVALILVTDAKIQNLNLRYRDKDKPTDVLSFQYEEEGDLGDVFISVDTAKRQAKEKGHSLEREMEILFVHGVLHLMGFDHNNDHEEAEMEDWAKKMLE